MTSDQLRIRFLNFFKKRGHAIIPSDSLIPRHDPTLLFTGAGMNQFKDQFMGRNVTFERAATCQKCLRTADLEKVGKTPGHHTLFEMLGNFSFGDYFKKETITWAWEFLTKDMCIPKEKLWVSVFEEDDDAHSIWKNDIGVPEYQIKRLGDKENFWPSEVKKNGPNGPCGPCSEIFYDWGEGTGCGRKECNPSCDCERFVEVWNLVFTQFDRKEGGVLKPLPSKNIDTGMGLERLAAVMQKKKTNFEIDIFSYIINVIAKEIHLRYGRDRETDSHINAIADHSRAVAFAISDGIRPSNEGRGFVIRKLIRKASQRARALGMSEPFIYKLIPSIGRVMKAAYPEIAKNREDISGVVLKEEINIKEIIDTILPHVEEDFSRLKDEGKESIPGEMIFRYYDEKGIPLDLIEEKAKEINLTLEIDGFNRLLEEQKARSRDRTKVASFIFVEKLSDIELRTKFLDKETKAQATVLGMLKETDSRTERTDSVKAKDIVHIALDVTPFYGEAGGQAGDRGEILKKGVRVSIYDAKRYEETIDHIGEVLEGVLSVGDKVEARIDADRRERIKRNHTATHLLHSALREILGGHVQQYGSLVEEDRLRFDFTHTAKMEDRQIERVEELVNNLINRDIPVETALMSLQDAKRSGAIALFGEKYNEKVLVRTIGDVSKELCGGTHVDKTGVIGVFKILNESSIASGVRRLEAVTGSGVYNWLKDDIKNTVSEYRSSLEAIRKLKLENDTIKNIEDFLRPFLFNVEGILKKDVKDLCRRELDLWVKELKPKFTRTIEDLSGESKKIKRKIHAARLDEVKKNIEEFIKGSESIDGVSVIAREIEDADMEVLRRLLDNVKAKLVSGVVILGAKDGARASLVCGITDDLVKKGLDAARIAKKIAQIIGGSGGGRPDMAQAGGRRPEKLKEALRTGLNIIKEEMAK